MAGVVQRVTATRGHPSSSTSPFLVTLTLPGVTAGNTILVVGGSVSYPATSITDDKGNTYTPDVTSFSLYFVAAARTVAGASGDTTITVSFSTSTACIIMAVEIAEATPPSDVVDFHSDQSSPVFEISTSLSLSSAPGYMVAILIGAAGQGFNTGPIGPFIERVTLAVGSGGSSEFGRIMDNSVADTSSQSADWGEFTAAGTCTVMLVGYAIVGEAVHDNPTKDNVRRTPYFSPPDANYSYYRPSNKFFPTTYLPDALFKGPKNQNRIQLPDYTDTSFHQKTKSPLLTNQQPVRDTPEDRQPSQRIDPLPEYNHLWYQVRRFWPIPVEYFPTAPATRRPDQRWWDIPIWDDYTAWRVGNKVPGPSLFLVATLGRYNIFGQFQKETHRGGYRIANAASKGYAVWIGVGALPDLTKDPDFTSAALPIQMPIPIPLVKTTYYVVVRKRDSYGLVSQNQRPTLIIVGADGVWVLPPIPTPTDLKALVGAGSITIRASYPTVAADPYPADIWKIWLNTTVPNVNTDLPTLISDVGGNTSVVQLKNYGQSNALHPVVAGNTYNYAIGLFRSADSQLSTVLTGSIVYPAPLSVPGDVHGPFTVGY